MIDKRLLDILVCPACRTPVRLEGERLICQNPECGLRYPVRDDIPVMLIQEAEKPPGKAEGRGAGGEAR
ncbi:MAG: Trm112 family protein [Planctomycetes bacterium]|nr:Trm112 family protein [Planctomycetota bacterium]